MMPQFRSKPIVPRPLVVLCSASLTFLILFAALMGVLNSTSTYSHINDPTLQAENRAILVYLNGPLFAENTFDFLTQEERSHMNDVKMLFDIAFILSLIGLGILIGTLVVFTWHKMKANFDELLGRILRASGWTILLICFMLGAMSFLNFDRFWILFHYIFFPQGNWMFATNSKLITLYPAEFFAGFVLRWLLLILTFAIAAIIISYFMQRMRIAEHAFTQRYLEKQQRHTRKK
jgi:integral membrane protein (TIGR01906 family)